MNIPLVHTPPPHLTHLQSSLRARSTLLVTLCVRKSWMDRWRAAAARDFCCMLRRSSVHDDFASLVEALQCCRNDADGVAAGSVALADVAVVAVTSSSSMRVALHTGTRHAAHKQ